jgi:HEPN domain-containing protein
VTSDRLARDYLQRARTRLIGVKALMTAGGYPDVVRESQDLVELTLKGALRFAGVDPPKRHDVRPTLEAFLDRFPSSWRLAMTEAGDDLGWLADQRGPAFYGDEAEGVPASALFGAPEAQRAVAVAERFLDLFSRLLDDPSSR